MFRVKPQATAFLFLHLVLLIGSIVLPSRVADSMARCLVSESYVAIELLKIIFNLALSDTDQARDNTVLTALVTAF